jgi:hypothetical protein
MLKTFQVIWSAEMLVPAGMMCAKNSILFFYSRIFAVDRTFSLSIKIITILNTSWFIAATVSLVFQCRPVAKAWDPLLPGKCFPFPPYMVAIEVPNSLLDFVIMALPINMLRSLRINLKEKVVLVFIFVMGGM